MSEWSQSAEEPHDDTFFAKRQAAAKRSPAEVLPVLRNWQVLDGDLVEVTLAEEELAAGEIIEGEATVITAAPVAATPADLDPLLDAVATAPTTLIADQHDPALIATLTERALAVQPGAEVTYTLSLLNNGPHAGLFTVTVEGWIDERWLVVPTPSVDLAPGERRTVTVTLQPPRTTRTLAGTRALVFCIRADSYPDRFSRLGALLTIEPYCDLRIGQVQPQHVSLSWRQPAATLTLPVINRSNHLLAIRLSAHDREQQCHFTVTLPGSKASAKNVIKLQPGQRVEAAVQVRLHSHPRWRSRKLALPIQLRVAAIDGATPVQRATASVTALPLIGLWQLTSVVGVSALILAAIGVAGLSALLLFAISFAQPTGAGASIQAAPPPIVIYVQSPLPERQVAAASVLPAVMPAPVVSEAPAAQSNVIQVGQDARDFTAPLVSVEQISAPGAPAAAVAVSPAAVTTAGTPSTATMTYGTLFQEIALRYDLNWRLLAAQAYVESGFDSLALGQRGDLGLMQIAPGTWREWAPKVKVADPFDSYSNVLVSAVYSDYLRTTLSKRGFGQPQWTLVAYNWGVDKVLQHLESGKDWDDLDPARQQYATEVMRLAETINVEGR